VLSVTRSLRRTILRLATVVGVVATTSVPLVAVSPPTLTSHAKDSASGGGGVKGQASAGASSSSLSSYPSPEALVVAFSKYPRGARLLSYLYSRAALEQVFFVCS
jgi:hypothetical protein